jgi:hypothetical protein
LESAVKARRINYLCKQFKEEGSAMQNFSLTQTFALLTLASLTTVSFPISQSIDVDQPTSREHQFD